MQPRADFQPPPPLAIPPDSPRARGRSPGFSLIEIIISMLILSMVATGVIAALTQSHKLAESNLAQAFAEVTAQSIVEQLVAQPYAVLTDPAATHMLIKLPGLDASNRTTMDDFQLPWAANDTTFTAIGTPDTSKGILVDAAYIRESNTIRPERYLPMRMNLRREISSSATERRVLLTLRYQWAVPDRRSSSGTPIYLSGELRTVRSSAASF
jgi:prepilin-type N-terminal cleavage/methylation domain-containing protein